MIETKVKSTEDRNIALVEKGESGVLVAIRQTCCIVLSTTHRVHGNSPFIPYVSMHNDFAHAYEDYLHVLGKMVLKEPTSKYFDNPVYAEHCKNGHPRGKSVESWESMARDIIQSYQAFESIGNISIWKDNPPTGKDLDAMTVEEIRAYVDSVDYQTLLPVLDACSFACIKRTYAKYFGSNPVSTETRERVIATFRLHKQSLARWEALIGPCV